MLIQNRNTEPRPRHFHRGDTGMPNLTEQQIRKLNDVFDFEDELGIPLDRYGYPRSTKNNAKAPRAFVLSPNSYHIDEVNSFADQGLEIGSEEFWRQVQLGNVFVYPAGQKEPSQLQINIKKDATPTLSLSKPLQEKDMPPRAEVKRPNFWHRMWAWAVPSYKERVESWDNRYFTETNIREGLRAQQFDRNSAAMEAEIKDAADRKLKKEQEAEKEAYFEAHRRQQDEMEKEYEDRDLCLDNMDRIYGIRPSAKDKFLQDDKWATKEEFDQLKNYNNELKMHDVKKTGERFDDDDFATLAYWNCHSDKYLDASIPHRHNYDPKRRSSLEQAGLSKEEVDIIMRREGMMTSTTDIFNDSGALRGKDGTMSIKPAIQPAREDTKDAFLAYQGGDKTPLARMMAEAVRSVSRTTKIIENSEGQKFKYQPACELEMCGRLGQLLEKDPDLERIAREKYGMKDEDLKAAKGMAEYKRLTDARRDAKKRLTSAEAQGKKLSPEEKQRCVKDIVKADIMEMALVNYTSTRKHDKRVDEAFQKIASCLEVPRKNPETGAPLPLEPGKLDFTVGQNILSLHLPALYDKPGKLIMDLEANNADLEKAADEVIRQDKLNDPNLTPGQLYDKAQLYSPQALNAAANIMAPKKEQKAIDPPQAAKKKDGPEQEQLSGDTAPVITA